MEAGPIPWRDMIHYAERAGLDDAQTEAFVTIVSEMDAAWRGWQGESAAGPDRGGGS